MSKPIIAALLLAVAVHVIVVMSLAGLSVRRLPSLPASPARRFAVDLYRQADPALTVLKGGRKVVSSIAPSEMEHPVPPERVKPKKEEGMASGVHDKQPGQESEKKLAKKTEPPKTVPKSAKEFPQAAGRLVNGSDVETKKTQPGQPGSTHEYRLVREPSLASQPSPLRYPLRARRMGQEGVVILDIKLDTHGSIVSMAVEKTSGYKILDNAALTAVRRWRFLPLMENGQAIHSQVRIPVRFKL